MNNVEDCAYRDEYLGCLDCYIERCPYVEETRENHKPLLIFKVNCAIAKTIYEQTVAALRSQVKDGVILLPPYISLEAIVGEDCTIKIVKECED